MKKFEDQYLNDLERNNPELFQVVVFILSKINKFNRDLKILIYILISFLFPIYLLVFQFIFKN